MGEQKDKIYADRNISAGTWVYTKLLPSNESTANCPVQPKMQEHKWSCDESLSDSWLPEMTRAVNIMTLVSSVYWVVRFRILSDFLHSVSTVANLKCYTRNWASKMTFR